jgi:hypothetical protein
MVNGIELTYCGLNLNYIEMVMVNGIELTYCGLNLNYIEILNALIRLYIIELRLVHSGPERRRIQPS